MAPTKFPAQGEARAEPSSQVLDDASGEEFAASPADERRYYHGAGRRQRDERRAYRRGRHGPHHAGEGLAYPDDDELQKRYEEGLLERGEPDHDAPAGSGLSASDGAGFLLGVFAWAVVLNFLRGGGPQVRQWLKAKFTGEVSADPAAGTPAGAPATPASPTSPTPGRAATPAAPAAPETSS